jgi:hypothetical protein
VTCVGRYFESAIRRDFAGFFHLIKKPEIAFVVDKEGMTTESYSPLNVFNCTYDLLLTA